MRILSITAQKPHSTGSGTYLTELVRAFDRMGHTQAVVCGIYPTDIVDFPDGVDCFPVFFEDGSGLGDLPFPIVGMSDIMPYESTRYRELTPEMVAQFEAAFIGADGSADAVGKAGAVRRAIEDLDPDLIICHHLFLLTALVRKHFPERRVIGISHGTDLRQMVNCDNLRELVRPEIAKLDMALALHEEQRDQIMDLFGLDESKVAVIGSGYNDGLFNTEGRAERKPGEPVRICYAGKISRPKGVPEMLAALSMIAESYSGVKDDDRNEEITGMPTEGLASHPDFRLIMAGGCQDEVLKDKLKELPDWAEWLGQIPQPALAELLRRTDIFVLPSYFEGLPLVLIEAMASGAVPIGADLPGVRQWIDANVGRPNVVYVDMPEMKSIDEPTDAGRDAFTIALSAALKDTIRGFEYGVLPGVLPDTLAITWDGLAARLLKLCK